MDKDELYTITLYDGKPIQGEKIPARNASIPAPRPTVNVGSVAKYNSPPNVTPQALAKANPIFTRVQPMSANSQNKSFTTLAREYADKTHEQTGHISFMSYWPSYNDMSQSQLNWYFYLRSQLRKNEYLQTDLSYIFVYIYELIHQINVANPNEGFCKLVDVWKHYRKANPTLDRYLVEWLVDYIDYYNCDEKAAFELLIKEGLFLLLPTDFLFFHHINNGLTLPVELIARFSDYKFTESKFSKSENEILFLDNLSPLIDKIRTNMNQSLEGSFEKRNSITFVDQKRIPFKQALFDNPNSIKLNGYPPFEKHKPFRQFLTSITKEYENQLRTCLKVKGRLRYPASLSDEIISLCKSYAQSAAIGELYGQDVEIRIDPKRLSALIHDSDEVRKKLLEGNFEYMPEPELPMPVEIADDTLNAEDISDEPKNGLLPGLSATQKKIIAFLLNRGGTDTMANMSAAFPGVFVGVEIDRINDMALETINDLLIGFENEYWYVIEDYINDLSE